MAADTFHLHNVQQADLPQGAAEAVTMRPGQHVVEEVENNAGGVGRDRFLDKQFGTASEAGGAVGFRWHDRSGQRF